MILNNKIKLQKLLCMLEYICIFAQSITKKNRYNMETILENAITEYFSKKRNYRFYSWFKKCIDKVVCNGNGAANLCRFVDNGTKCLINKTIANNKDIFFIKDFCEKNNISVEFIEVCFHKNDL